MNDNIFGCFFKVGFDPNSSEQNFEDLANTFKTYVWGETGIYEYLKDLKHENYGKDLKMILLQFYVKPSQAELQKLKSIEQYRKNEKSIGIPIIINDDNFFSKSENLRHDFLKQSILEKMDALAEVIRNKKLDTRFDLIMSDLVKLLS